MLEIHNQIKAPKIKSKVGKILQVMLSMADTVFILMIFFNSSVKNASPEQHYIFLKTTYLESPVCNICL